MRNIYNRTVILLTLLVICTLSACAKMPPKCSDEETLHLVREIIFGKEYTEKELKDNIIFEYPLATAEDKNIKKISCEARLNVANTYQLPITYASQLDDKNQHIVSVGGVSQDDTFLMLAKLSNAVKKTRTPVEPEKTKELEQPIVKTEELELQHQVQESSRGNTKVDRVVPPYADYMPNCMAHKESAEPSGEFGSILERGMAKALCQCQFEHFPTSGVMTTDEFFNSAIQCKLEQDADFKVFTLKYLPRANLKK
jgi:hypothetical protein